MGIGDFPYQGLPKSRALWTSGHKGFEQVIADRRGGPGSIIMNGKLEVIALTIRADENLGMDGRGLDGIQEQIVERSTNLLRIQGGGLHRYSRFKG